MKRLLVLLIALASLSILQACGQISLHERSVLTIQGTEKLLAEVQDTERQLCNQAAYAAAPDVAVKECAGPLAEAVQLTTARHQAIHAGLSRAFAVQIKAAIAVRAWRPGDPMPSDVPELLKATVEVKAVLDQLAPNSRVTEILGTIIQVRDDLEELVAAVEGARNK